MSALDGISLNAKISLAIAGIIMLTFFTVQTCIVFGLCEPSLELAKFGWGCVVFFMPPFFKVVQEFLVNKAKIRKELGDKNVYLEHAAKIIRHDMHSGINTYIPRGIKSLKRRLTDEQIKELKISSPLKLIEDGLHHARKVYSGVYEFTNLFKENAQMSKTECNIKEILKDYLKLTAYNNQVILDNNLPTQLIVNEPLFCTAIDNLIRNGLKYNDSPTKWVKIYHEGNYHNGSHICIEDNGRGLTMNEFIELSKPYVRKEGQKESGTGLGLNICISILKEHGFSVWAEKQKQGTKIKIKI
jgi:K+-sensing histidine kinase KdpD